MKKIWQIPYFGQLVQVKPDTMLGVIEGYFLTHEELEKLWDASQQNCFNCGIEWNDSDKNITFDAYLETMEKK